MTTAEQAQAFERKSLTNADILRETAQERGCLVLCARRGRPVGE